MSRWVICFDPWYGLKLPAPALYPEMGERFRHYPGLLTNEDWLDISVVLAEAKPSPEFWLLAPAERSELEVSQIVRELAEVPGIPPEVAGSGFNPTLIFWGTTQFLHLIETPHHADTSSVVVDLLFDGDAQVQQHWSQSYLLPLALRFLLERDQHLTRERRDAIARITIRSQSAPLVDVLLTLQGRLTELAKHVRYEQGALRARASEVSCYETKLESCPETFDRYEARPPRLSSFYSEREDERRAYDWLKSEVGDVLSKWDSFVRKVGDWQRDQRQHLTGQKPTRRHTGQTPEELHSAFLGELNKLGTSEDASFASGQAEKLVDQQLGMLARALRRRPTVRLFAWFSIITLALAGTFVWQGAALSPGSAAYVWVWPGVSLVALAGLSALTLELVQIDKRRALKGAVAALGKLYGEAIRAGDRAKENAGSFIARLLLNRNLEIVEGEIRARAILRSQWEYHLDQMQIHCEALGDWTSWGTEVAHLPGAEIDPARHVAGNVSYCWRSPAHAHAQLKLGQDCSMLEDRQGRFAGVAEIRVETR
ncbi:MAG: hypothetical protein ACT4PZ_11210 [Panacagrimonas sp.]